MPEANILSSYGKILVRENKYSGMILNFLVGKYLLKVNISGLSPYSTSDNSRS